MTQSAMPDMCRPMMELLFARLQPALRGLALRQLGRFLTGSSLPSVAHEAAVLANAAAWADPAGTALTGSNVVGRAPCQASRRFCLRNYE